MSNTTLRALLLAVVNELLSEDRAYPEDTHTFYIYPEEYAGFDDLPSFPENRIVQIDVSYVASA